MSEHNINISGALQTSGFADEAEFHALVGAADLSSPDKVARFEQWKSGDGSKAGLLALNRQPTSGGEHNIISVSGGKDSTALLLLAIERGAENMQAVFADTGHEHQETYEYVQYLSDTVFPIRTIRADFSAQIATKRANLPARWAAEGISQDKIDRALALLHPTGNPFLDLCLWKGRFPSTRARFCSEELKRNPIIAQVQKPLLAAGDDIISWQGVRADESPSRALLPENECKFIDNDTQAELWNFRPILKWTVEDVFAMHRKHGVKPNPLYSKGMTRVGCMPCIHARKDELLMIGQRFPEEVARVAEWERLVADCSKRDMSTFFAADKTPGRHKTDFTLPMPGIYQVIEWAKTSRGGTNFDMFRIQDVGPLCSSIYGLCE
ncbi:phosphoadenosine phosphosulfate reductase family protein [Massilia sp. TS11]|uniref:phosphoadenosine phosphosulfate reductase domain-containing protein n=1 Tax=Massilia sp. TS11 TaxID=2908003 RepID=UPI001EDA89BC|nr:phosphoadenosine phosphosulfate reductase family protein [Massilia sp. TS11]MCG2586518.1 phosphoadenosine phosphosulfate reductase family protein [Massilia sp. TS11]